MTNYFKVNTSLVVSNQADYNQGLYHAEEFTSVTPTAWGISNTVSAATTGTTFYIDHLSSTISGLIHNTSASYTVFAKYYVERASLSFATNELAFVTGPPDTIVESAASSFLDAANYFVPHSIARITGCTDAAANNTDYNIQKVAATTLTLFKDDTVTAEAAEAGLVTIKCLIPTIVKIGPGAIHQFSDIVPADNITLTALTGAAVCRVSYVGLT